MEGDVDHPFLNLVEVEQAGQQQRPHLADRGADRVALFAEQIPELHRRRVIAPVGHADVGSAGGKGLVHSGGRVARHGEAGEVALHVGHECGDADRRQALDNALQGDGLAGSGRAGNEAVAIGALQFEQLGIGSAATGTDEDIGWLIAHVSRPSSG